MDIYVLPLELFCLKVMGYLTLGMKARANIKFHRETIIMAQSPISFFFIFFGLLSMVFQNVKKFRHSFTRIELVLSMFPYLCLAFPDIIQFFVNY